MKVSVVLVSLFVFFQMKVNLVTSRTVQDRTQLEPEEDACIEELKLNKNEIKALNGQDIIPENNSEFNNFIGCYWQKMGWQNSDGKINFESLIVSLQDEVAGNVETENPAAMTLLKQMVAGATEECQRIIIPAPNSNHGQTAVKVQNCIVKLLHELMKEHVSLISHIL